MALSWNEIKSRAVHFSKEWENESHEDAEGKSFLDNFFNVFGVNRRRIGSFEMRVKKIGNKDGYIDMLWKGMILIEQKSKGEDLDKAYQQAKDYFPGLKDIELPRYILVSDFDRFRLYDLEKNTQHDFQLKDLYKNVKLFSEIAGYLKTEIKEQDPVNIDAAIQMGKLHDKLKVVGYEGHVLEVYLVRTIFCLFADDTTIFEKDIFQDYIKLRTSEDGSDLAAHLSQLFQILNTPHEKRLKNIDELLNTFPYVNGKLFQEVLPMASFDSEMREILLECSSLNWAKISPAIFGSMFQSVMNDKERRNLGAHYTSEKNILKLIKPLFLDELWTEFERIKNDKRKLSDFHKKLSTLKFFDPACGCGNFLVITYRELRLLEIEVLKVLQKGQQVTHIDQLMRIDVDQFYGIEIDEWPAQIAQVALWLIDHQMNMKVSEEFGEYFIRLPLKKSPSILQGDALELDWNTVVPRNELSYILGNPPFIGSKLMTQLQRAEIVKQFDNVEGSGVLDYVTGWYIKAAKYIQNKKIKVGFVSTNSIVQGEQTSILWGQMMNKFNIKIHFAHRTFKWSNEAKGNAAVYCVIIGFANFDSSTKFIYEYEDIKGEPHELKAKNINAYLVDAKDVIITKSSNPICHVPKMSFGNMPLDGGNLLLSDEEKRAFLLKEPKAKKYIKPLISAHEFLNGEKRWCLWLVGADPSELKQMPDVLKRVDSVKKFRLNSTAPSTQKFALTPTLFRDRNQPETYILIPRHSSENRQYIPMGFFDKTSIPSDSCLIIPNGNLYHFGILMSKIHMAWVKNVCGRLESRFRYSKDIVYNNFPWPESPSEKQKKAIEQAAQKILNIRKDFPESSLADLYDPLTMPHPLVKAHKELDKVADLCYRSQLFTSETNRIAFLFELYDKYTSGLFAVEKKKKDVSNAMEIPGKPLGSKKKK
jgi:hypothetical protein